ncbi:MAG: rhodanese-like domain-containing protein [Leptospira sp.]|nr:rhodanese-like domain-containing protein [Leptospira sp.]
MYKISAFNKFRNRVILLLGLFFCLVCLDAKENHPSNFKVWDLSSSWVISPLQALNLEKNGAKKVDARGLHLRFLPPLKSSVNMNWEEFTFEKQSEKGKLLGKEIALKKLKKIGIETNSTILVFGDSLDGWGEEGRIVWMLRELGIQSSYLVDGGVKHFNHLKSKKGDESKSQIQNFHSKSKIVSSFNIEAETLSELVKQNSQKIEILDVREKREFLGDTPYGESRRGHISGAKWLFYREFIDESGFIKSSEEIIKLLHKKNISLNVTLVSYCTGGVRSAFTTAVLVSYGFKALNYSGSMWEWTSKDITNYPTITGDL